MSSIGAQYGIGSPGSNSLDSVGPGTGNLEAIIAATIRAVTAQMGSNDAATMMRSQGGAMGLPGVGAMDMGQMVAGGNAFGIGSSPGNNRWPGSGAMNMPAMSPSSYQSHSDSDPNTLYVGNVCSSFLLASNFIYPLETWALLDTLIC